MYTFSAYVVFDDERNAMLMLYPYLVYALTYIALTLFVAVVVAVCRTVAKA